ncbi:MAG: hypothetical protein CBC35_01655 [Planctomycetes bacterium TMED75]|nr:MAG: hypothetical protein CBC35_01655 [Planctomycetes bacterium TMED75]
MKYTVAIMEQTPEQNTVLARVSELVRNKYFTMAREVLNRELAEDPANIPLRVKLVEIYNEIRDFQEACRLLTELLVEVPDNDRLFSLYPQVLLGAGRPDEGIERALELQERLGKGSFHALGLLAELYETTSRTDDLRELVDRMAPKGPVEELIRDYSRARLLLRDKEYESAVQLFDEIRTRLDADSHVGEDIRLTRMVDCGFQMCKAYDRMGDYDSAWAAATRAHQDHQAALPSNFSSEEYRQNLESIMELMDKETLASLAHAQEDLEWEPLYIVGNPRSGTSLLEQILSMHPDIANGGEMSISLRLMEDLPRLTDSYHGWPNSVLDMQVGDANALGRMYMSALAHFSAGKKIVSNKALNLQAQLGFLSLVTPNAKAIMLYRYPLDNCVSCYTTNLLTSGHLYCSDLDELANVWLARRKIMEHWFDRIEMPLMELHYEGLVQNQEYETRRLIEFLGLEWDESCLEFYKSKFVARTISYDQVNRKMYTTSDGRWKNYEKHLGPLADKLSDYL